MGFLVGAQEVGAGPTWTAEVGSLLVVCGAFLRCLFFRKAYTTGCATVLCQSGRPYEPMLVRTDEQLLAIGDAEFVEDAGEVVTDRNARDAEAVGNIFVGESLTDQPADLALSFGQDLRPLGRSGSSGGHGRDSRGVAQLQLSGPVTDRQHDLLRLRGEMVDGRNEYSSWLHLQDNAIDSGRERLPGTFRIIESAE